MFDLLDCEAGIVFAYDKAFDLVRALVACPDDVDVSEGGIANPLFLAVEHPGIAKEVSCSLGVFGHVV